MLGFVGFLQIHEVKKLAYQTRAKVVVAYGGASISQQPSCESKVLSHSSCLMLI